MKTKSLMFVSALATGGPGVISVAAGADLPNRDHDSPPVMSKVPSTNRSTDDSDALKGKTAYQQDMTRRLEALDVEIRGLQRRTDFITEADKREVTEQLATVDEKRELAAKHLAEYKDAKVEDATGLKLVLEGAFVDLNLAVQAVQSTIEAH